VIEWVCVRQVQRLKESAAQETSLSDQNDEVFLSKQILLTKLGESVGEFALDETTPR
jgi:hypothetical protein